MSARLGVDLLLMEAREVQLSVSANLRLSRLQIVPDVDLSIQIWDSTMMEHIVVSEHVDWVVGYQKDGEIAVSCLVLQARTPALFSQMYLQLVTSLGNFPPYRF